MRAIRWMAGCLFSAALGVASLAAQESAGGSLSGRLTGALGAPAVGATVAIPALDLATETDADGAWRLAGLPAGSHEVVFTAGGHSERVRAEVGPGAEARLDHVLATPTVPFAETITVVSASRQAERVVDAPAAINVIPAIEIERRAATGQIPKLLEFETGVEVTQSGIYDYNFNTRGFNSSLNRRVATVIDGRDPSVPFLGAQEWAAVSFPMDDLAQVEFVRGPSAALYGPNSSSGVLNLITKRPRDSQGGLVRLAGGELSTLNADLRWALPIGGDWFAKALASYRSSGDFAVSRNGAAEYAVPCTATITSDCLPQERVPLDPLDDDEVTIASARVDRHYGDTSLLTLEGGWAEVSGPVFQTGIGRVQLVDVERSWARANFSTPHWNLMVTGNGRQGDEQTALATGINLVLDEEAWRGELQANYAFLDDTLRLVGGLAYEDRRIDSADQNARTRPRLFGKDRDNLKRLRQTLLFEPIDSTSTAAFGQMDWHVSDRVALVVAARYDDSTLHEPKLSPKAALVFSLTSESSIRLTYNQAFQTANYSEYFLQAEVGPAVNLGKIPCPAGATLGGIPCPSVGYLNLEEICVLDGVLCGFDADFQIGALPGSGGGPTSSIETADTQILALGNADLEVEEVETWEVGYTGLLGGKLLLTLDYYNSKNDNFITDLLPQLGTPLGRINPNFGPYTLPAGLTPEHQQQILAVLQLVLGRFYPLLTTNLDGTPMIGVASYTNFGEVDTQGADLGMTFYLSPEWTLALNYSWFDFEIQDSLPGLDRLLLPNSPENKYAGALTYAGARFDATLAYRWVEGFRWAVGPFQGDVLDYDTVDVVANFRINDFVELGLNVANALDEEHWESFGGDLLGRRALGSITFRW